MVSPVLENLLYLLLGTILGRWMDRGERSHEHKKRKKHLKPLVIHDGDGVKRYFAWRGRGDVHILEGEEQPRQLRQISQPLCDALRQHSGMGPQFNRPDNIRGEVVHEVSSDFKAKWRLLGGMNNGTGNQGLVLVPRQQQGG